MMLAVLRPMGRAGSCTTCTGTEGDEVRGPRATVYGIVGDTGSPPTISVTAVRPASELCNTTVYEPTTRSCASGQLLPLFRAHGSLMLTSWGVLLPLGVMIALTGRHRDPLWFHLHRGCQCLGLVLALAGWILALSQFSVFSTGGTRTSFLHACLGCTVMSLGLLQPLNALLRPHKDTDAPRSTMRFAWELLHKSFGYVAVVLSIVTIVLGTLSLPEGYLAFQVSFGVLWALVLTVGLYLRFVDANAVRGSKPGERAPLKAVG